MINLVWTAEALKDLERLHAFFEPVNQRAADRVVRSLLEAPTRLQVHPRLGRRLARYDPREARRIIVGEYELRYEITQSVIVVLRLWHARERRPGLR